MCHKYWPDTGSEMYGSFEVTLYSHKEYPDYVLREFKIVDSRVSYSYMCLFISLSLFRIPKVAVNMSNNSSILAGPVREYQTQL